MNVGDPLCALLLLVLCGVRSLLCVQNDASMQLVEGIGRGHWNFEWKEELAEVYCRRPAPALPQHFSPLLRPRPPSLG